MYKCIVLQAQIATVRFSLETSRRHPRKCGTNGWQKTLVFHKDYALQKDMGLGGRKKPEKIKEIMVNIGYLNH